MIRTMYKFIKFTNSPEEGDALLKQLKKLRVQGSVNFDDRFDKDYILSIRSIEAIEEDNKMNGQKIDQILVLSFISILR